MTYPSRRREQRRVFRPVVGLVSLVLLASGCVAESQAEEPVDTVEQSVTTPAASTFPATYARQWMVNLANSVKNDRISPPVAARTYTYGAIAVYESVVNGMPGYRSLAGQINGLTALPTPDPAKQYDWPSVLAQTMHRVVHESIYVYPERVFFEYTTMSQATLTELGPTQLGYRRAAGVPADVIANSVAYGNQLADALAAWVNSDGYRDIRYKGYIPPTGDDKWVPTGFGDKDKIALPNEPHFGKVRPVALTTGNECTPVNGPPAFSTAPDSAFYQQAKFVYDTETNTTETQREIARFWADGPGDTPTPAGHWLALITKQVRAKNLAEAAAGYAFGTLGFLDAFIAVWESKYKYNVLRPETYIRRHIDPVWRPFLPTPQFPSYVSGHSGVSGASGKLLTVAFGNGPVVDDTKLRRGFGPHSYANYTAAAEEAAVSRLYAGIHYDFDDNDGLTLGNCVADKIIARVHLQ